MKLTEIKSNRIKDKYFICTHDSGLKIYLYPKSGFKSTYAVFGTKYGSINTNFSLSVDQKIIEVPDGTAHFLEHKMFEKEDGDAFEKYAKTGASANAYTSFDKTCYLFSCTENFEESLKILIDLVQNPYFTKETVKKEQGIIGQEIKMYDDDPNWKVMFNLLKAMYQNHPVNIDIAGTIETIATITPEKLYECYNAFYNPNNMTICIAGNFDPEKTMIFLDSILKKSETVKPVRIFPYENYSVYKKRIEEKFPISCPLFQLGFKEDGMKTLTSKKLAETDILLDILASKSSYLYRKLLDSELINNSFSYEYFHGQEFAAIIFSGESKNPDKVAEIIKKEIKELKNTGIDQNAFNRSKKSIYGKTLSLLNSSDNIANALLDLDFSNRELFDSIECIINTKLEDINLRLNEQLDIENSTLSVVLPTGDDE